MESGDSDLVPDGIELFKNQLADPEVANYYDHLLILNSFHQ